MYYALNYCGGKVTLTSFFNEFIKKSLDTEAELWHALHVLVPFYVLCKVIVLDWTVKCYVCDRIIIFKTVSVFYCHYLLLLIYRMSGMHL